MNPWRNFQAWRYERQYTRRQRQLTKAYALVNADLARRMQNARDAWIRNEASRGIADMEQEINRRQR